MPHMVDIFSYLFHFDSFFVSSYLRQMITSRQLRKHFQGLFVSISLHQLRRCGWFNRYQPALLEVTMGLMFVSSQLVQPARGAVHPAPQEASPKPREPVD
jgi:hypothetical protein